MANLKTFMKSGHPPTLFAAFLYFDFSFAVWVLNGAMGPFISEQFHLSQGQVGLMVSVPTLAGAFMRFPLGVVSQYIGRKKAAIIEMSAIVIALLYGFFFVKTFHDVLAMGVLLGIAGASFGVALSLGSGWFPKQYKGLAMGIAGAGNSGTAVAALFAPRLATHYGWQHVYGFAAAMMLLPLIVMIVFAKEPPDIEHQSLADHLKCLWEKDGWAFNLVYIITFGGFIGLATFLPSFFVKQFHVTKIQAGSLTVLATLTGSATRVLGGWFADRIGGITTLSVVFLIVIAGLFGLIASPSLLVTTLLFMLCFAALGAGNGATFQLVPLRWPITTAVAGGMIGEIGALGGGILPNLLGQSKQHTGSYSTGFIAYAALACLVLILLRVVSRRWMKTWVGAGGRALSDDKVMAIAAD
ncbi:MAG TPA: MFS transporter [Edaphobacter sp.]|uniref:nitrate/nitrite transporter n=1 Tax=Edaphobacter sp. TaxID=1934404 RepID=UPI002BDC0B46|nr:MFS transporter [Edaphobacter sp.]HUZ94398.1 MFS transporter [Edaphobacter sp.]